MQKKAVCEGLPDWSIALRDFRYKQHLTQAELAKLICAKQANISKMELGKRPIGKKVAKRLATHFDTDYRIFL